MKLNIKLGLLFGSLTVLLIMSAVMSYVLVDRIGDNVQALGKVDAPLEKAVSDMEISISEGINHVIEYSIDRNEMHVQLFKDTEIDFLSAMARYTQLADTEEGRDAGLRVGQIYKGFGSLSNKLIEVTNNIRSNVTRLKADVSEIEEMLGDQLVARIDLDSAVDLKKIEAVLGMAIDTDEAFLAIQSYIASPDPRYRQNLSDEEGEFRETEAAFRSGQLSLEEEDLVSTISSTFLGVITTGNQVMDQVDEQRGLILKLANDLESINRILDEDVRPLELAATMKHLNSAEASVGVAKLSSIVLVALGAVVGLGAMAIVARQIVNPIVSLTEVATEFARGNLGVRANGGTSDEIGSLADSFNQMARARQLVEEESLALIAELAEQNAELAQLDELKDNFMSSVSHELRTPLTAIKGSAEILLDGEGVTEEIQKQFLTIINSESDRLTRLINDVLDLARIEAGQEQWHDEFNSMSDIIQSAVSGIQSLAIQNCLDLVVTLDPDLPDVWCDRDKVNQVLTNLLSNAIKFTPENGDIGVTVTERPDPGDSGGGRMLEVRVSDSGIGMSSADLKEVFKKFKQVGDAPADLKQGTGLGLPICKEIISHYNGDIWVESELGEGSVFIFTLPVRQADTPVKRPVTGG